MMGNGNDATTPTISNGWTSTTISGQQTFPNFPCENKKVGSSKFVWRYFVLGSFICYFCCHKCGITDGSKIWHTAEGRRRWWWWRQRRKRELVPRSGSSVPPQEDASPTRWLQTADYNYWLPWSWENQPHGEVYRRYLLRVMQVDSRWEQGRGFSLTFYSVG